jgi:endonuclease/exonuclease/phosphatase family metal-dependent hydrolase
MKFASFNVQYGFGLDGKFDPARVIDAVSGADVVAMQEVTRNLPRNSQADLPEIFSALLPDYFHAFGAGTMADAGSGIVDGRVRMRFVASPDPRRPQHPAAARPDL